MSPAGFVNQLVRLITKGYRFYVTGVVPKGKDPRALDAKLIEKYYLHLGRESEYARRKARSRNKAKGIAGVAYVRYERFYIIIATKGERHRFFNSKDDPIRPGESVIEWRTVNRDGGLTEYPVEVRIRDLENGESCIRFDGYRISKRPSADGSSWHSHVRIDDEEYQTLKAYLVELAQHQTVSALKAELHRVQFEPYDPVYKQMKNIVRAMNRARKERGFKDRLTYKDIRWKIGSASPFIDYEQLGDKDAA